MASNGRASALRGRRQVGATCASMPGMADARWTGELGDLRAVRGDRAGRLLAGRDSSCACAAVELSIDFHHLSVVEAALFCQRSAPLHLQFVEKPITPKSAGLSPTAQHDKCSVRHWREFSSKWAFVPFIEQGLLNYARIDVSNVGS